MVNIKYVLTRNLRDPSTKGVGFTFNPIIKIKNTEKEDGKVLHTCTSFFKFSIKFGV